MRAIKYHLEEGKTQLGIAPGNFSSKGIFSVYFVSKLQIFCHRSFRPLFLSILMFKGYSN